jgi:L-ascorbate metabolism protein UlaG (beta-lactamase superfamily)
MKFSASVGTLCRRVILAVIVQASDSGSQFPKHFDGQRFYNPNAAQACGWLDLLRWKLTSRREASPRFVFDVRQSIPPHRIEGGQPRITLVNHSTVLLQQCDCHILTDPIWSKRASPLSWIGPRRRRLPGVPLEDLPRIDIVLISHNHYDHLDLPTIRRLAQRGHAVFIVPLGLARLLRSEKIGPVYELDWGEATIIGATTIHAVPALHFAGRGIFDRDKTLWCGYVIRSRDGMVYFAGDTAFGPHFLQIRERFGSPRLSLLPIAAYQPRSFMSPIHMAPGEAVRAHQILGSGVSVAIHHGTFQLADDGLDTARKELQASARPDSFVVLENGQFLEIA